MKASREDATDDDVDEQFLALLEGLRTSLPGVQVLFAFLLTAPLQGKFSELSDGQRGVFATAFYAAGLSSVLLIAPSVHQRMRAPISGIRRRTRRHVVVATWLTIVGTGFMGVAVAATTYLVSDLVFGTATSVLATTVLSSTLVWSWVYLPLVAFRR
ncbi:MAG: DUF6328 family protein [Acidimicrobiales bacterium]|nr:DUF6328 family protein [Acidimicrobiales bacterium]